MDNANNEIKTKLMKRKPYDKDIYGNAENYQIIMDDIVEASENIALSLIYPFRDDNSDVRVPKKYKNWQYRCCLELYSLANGIGFISYAENGLSWNKLTDGISQSLKDEIISKVKVIKDTGKEAK